MRKYALFLILSFKMLIQKSEKNLFAWSLKIMDKISYSSIILRNDRKVFFYLLGLRGSSYSADTTQWGTGQPS